MYYIFVNNQTIGPMAAHQVFNYAVNPQTPISTDGFNWRPLSQYPELMQFAPRQRQKKTYDKTVCGIFALLLGGLGIQYFYLGKTTAGLLTILLSFITCGLWELLTFIQGIIILTMDEADFERKFVYSTSTLPLF